LVSNNIGQIAYLNAQAHGIQRIFFSGFYISGHAITMNTLSYAISFWSKGRIKAHFLRHEGYLGAIGAFLKNPPEDAKLKSFTENFSQTELGKGNVFGVGALEEFSSNLKLFPFLQDPSTYSPDTCKLQDVELQNYWIDLLDVNLKHLVDLATKKDAESLPRASMFEAMYRQHLSELKTNPNAYGPLTVRGLLHLREQCLREMGFNDIFRGIKEQENAASLAGIHHLFSNIDRLGKDELVETLLNNILAGNMYDWGSAVIQEMLKRGELDFQSAKVSILLF
jgi:type II pantothenate kinase